MSIGDPPPEIPRPDEIEIDTGYNPDSELPEKTADRLRDKLHENK